MGSLAQLKQVDATEHGDGEDGGGEWGGFGCEDCAEIRFFIRWEGAHARAVCCECGHIQSTIVVVELPDD